MLADVRGQKCTIEVDERIRLQHAKMHSAGHLLDVAVASIPGLDEYTRTDERLSRRRQGRLRRIQRQRTDVIGIEGDDEKLMKLMNENLEKVNREKRYHQNGILSLRGR